MAIGFYEEKILILKFFACGFCHRNDEWKTAFYGDAWGTNVWHEFKFHECFLVRWNFWKEHVRGGRSFRRIKWNFEFFKVILHEKTLFNSTYCKLIVFYSISTQFSTNCPPNSLNIQEISQKSKLSIWWNIMTEKKSKILMSKQKNGW